jgi:hypothetical protein
MATYVERGILCPECKGAGCKLQDTGAPIIGARGHPLICEVCEGRGFVAAPSAASDVEPARPEDVPDPATEDDQSSDHSRKARQAR